MASSLLPVSPGAYVLQDPRDRNAICHEFAWIRRAQEKRRMNGPKKKCRHQPDDVRRETASLFIETTVGSSFRHSLRRFRSKQVGDSLADVKSEFTDGRLRENKLRWWCGGRQEARSIVRDQVSM